MTREGRISTPGGSSRIRRDISVATGVLVAALLAAGCGSGEKGDSAQVPPALATIETTAEDAFDMALAGDSAAIQQKVTDLTSAWDQYRARATADGVSDSAVSSLDGSIQAFVALAAGAPAAVELARAANAVSEMLPQFYDLYQPAVPSQVLSLDYLGREMELDAIEGDFDRAIADLQRIDEAWQGFRDQVVAAGGANEAAAFDQSITAEGTAIESRDGVSLEAAAVQQLDLVDAIEQIFAASADPSD